MTAPLSVVLMLVAGVLSAQTPADQPQKSAAERAFELQLRRVPVEELPGGLPPIGAIVVYGRSQCGFSPEHGHIEIVVSQNPPKACSDGCTDMDKGRLACIQKKGKTGAVSVYIPVNDAAPDE